MSHLCIHVSTAQQVSCPSVFAVTVPTSRLSYECGRLRPQESYNISVAAINGAGKGERVTVSSTTACEGIESVVQLNPLMVCHLQCCICSVHQPPSTLPSFPPPSPPPPTHTPPHNHNHTLFRTHVHTHTHTHTHTLAALEPRVNVSQQLVNVTVEKRSCSIR